MSTRVASRSSAGRGARHRVAALLATVLVLSGLGMGGAVGDRAEAATPVGTIHTHGLGIRSVRAMVEGPDGNLWFTSAGNAAIGRLTPTGTLTMFTSSQIVAPNGIAVGADGNLWFTNETGASIGRITPSGTISRFPSFGINTPVGIAAGADGNLWFTSKGNHRIGRITTAGAITTFSGSAINAPTAITAGPDGALWFVNSGNNTIGRIATDGTSTSFSDPTLTQPNSITAGPDGNLWFADGPTASLGRLTPGGVFGAVVPTAGTSTWPASLVSGADGNLWFADGGASGGVVRMTTAGAATRVGTPPGWSGSLVAPGPGGRIWYANAPEATIGRVEADDTTTLFRGNEINGPQAVVLGPDGMVWVANEATGTVVRFTPAGVPTLVVETGAGGLRDLAVGPDGALWYVDALANEVGRVTLDGAVTRFSHPQLRVPTSIVTGPDGNLWVAGSSAIGRVTPAGTVTVFTGAAIGRPVRVVAGGDGNVWYTDQTGSGAVARITPAGTVTSFATPALASSRRLAAGPDGAVWFPTTTSGIGRMAADGTVTTYPLGSGVVAPSDIAAGPDGNLWFVATGSGKPLLGRLTLAGAVATFTDATLRSPARLATGPDGSLSFVDVGAGALGSVLAVSEDPPTIVGTVTDAGTGAPLPGMAVSVFADWPSWTVVGTAVTGSDGRYQVSSLVHGTYRVRVVDPTGTHARRWWTTAATYRSAAPLPLTLWEPAAVADVALEPSGGSIAGRVQDSAGPLAGISVRVYDATDGYVGGTVTGANGYYELRGLAAGSYMVQFVDPTGTHRQQWFAGSKFPWGATPVVLSGGRSWASALLG